MAWSLFVSVQRLHCVYQSFSFSIHLCNTIQCTMAFSWTRDDKSQNNGTFNQNNPALTKKTSSEKRVSELWRAQAISRAWLLWLSCECSNCLNSSRCFSWLIVEQSQQSCPVNCIRCVSHLMKWCSDIGSDESADKVNARCCLAIHFFLFFVVFFCYFIVCLYGLNHGMTILWQWTTFVRNYFGKQSQLYAINYGP